MQKSSHSLERVNYNLMVNNLFFVAVPVKFFTLTVSSCCHYSSYRMPKPGMYIPIGYSAPVTHTINPVIEVVLIFIAKVNWSEFHPILFSSYNFGFPFIYCLFHPFIKIKATRKRFVLRDKKPAGAAFPPM